MVACAGVCLHHHAIAAVHEPVAVHVPACRIPSGVQRPRAGDGVGGVLIRHAGCGLRHVQQHLVAHRKVHALPAVVTGVGHDIRVDQRLDLVGERAGGLISRSKQQFAKRHRAVCAQQHHVVADTKRATTRQRASDAVQAHQTKCAER